ncbi:hypothetical protein DL770_005084 [Monosporascus sp. CRB-9-2]|nr:hypothetical protein DL770_005084 [Monosporascus sp. CRB-9-2]
MLTTALVAFALAVTGLAQAPEGYRTVVIATAWDDNYVLQAAAPAQSGSAVILSSLKNAPEQQWYLKDGSTKLQLANTTLCLDAGTGRSNGSPLTVRDCVDGQASQNWIYNAEGQIVLDQAGPRKQHSGHRPGVNRDSGANFKAELCADLYFGSVRDNTPIVIWQCIAGDKNHLWSAADVTV